MFCLARVAEDASVARGGGRQQGAALLGREGVKLHGWCSGEGRDCLSAAVDVLERPCATPVCPRALG